MQAIKIVGLLFLAGVLAILAMMLIDVAPRLTPLTPAISSFDECVAAGNPVMESYPRQCRSADGQLFVEELQSQDQQLGGGQGMTFNGCAVAGCNGELCVSADGADQIMTTCQYKPEYACYQEASCEPQFDGKCGWTDSPALQQCLANPSAVDSDLQLEVM